MLASLITDAKGSLDPSALKQTEKGTKKGLGGWCNGVAREITACNAGAGLSPSYFQFSALLLLLGKQPGRLASGSPHQPWLLQPSGK